MQSYWRALRENIGTLLRLLVAIEILAAILILILPFRYESSATIIASEFSVSYSPQPPTGLNALSGLSIQSLLDRPPSLFVQFLNLATSPTVAERLLKTPDLVAPMFPDEWDAGQHKWVRPSGPIFTAKEAINAIFGFPAWTPPDKFRVSDYLSKHLVVLETTNGVVNISIRTKDADAGTRLLSAILSETADVMRASVEHNLQTQMSYMSKLLQDTSSLEARQAQIALATEAERRIILIQAGSPIGAQIIQPVSTDPRPVSPSLSLILGVAALFATALFVLIVLVRLRTGYSPRQARERRAATDRTAASPRWFDAWRARIARGAELMR